MDKPVSLIFELDGGREGKVGGVYRLHEYGLAFGILLTGLGCNGMIYGYETRILITPRKGAILESDFILDRLDQGG